jgi:hypothetical protein
VQAIKSGEQMTKSEDEPVGQETDPRPHELVTFMRQDAAEMQSEYDRIRAITSEDPGTAGDEGEETWANLLREWLPEAYQVVTKGRLLAVNGARGPQVDVIVLRPGYPKRLINKKLYLVGGVAAAFECKNTLKPSHVNDSFDQAFQIDQLSSAKAPTPFSEMVPEVYFGLLAHSTVWQSEASEQKGRMDSLLKTGLNAMPNMRSCPGFVCVADLGCWSVMRMTYDGPGLMDPEVWDARRALTGLPAEGAATVSYVRYVEEDAQLLQAPPNAISAAIAAILGRLAHADSSIRPLSQYFFAAGLQGSGKGIAGRAFALDQHYSGEVRGRLPASLTNGIAGSEWGMVYPF